MLCALIVNWGAYMVGYLLVLLLVKTTQNSTGGTGAHSAGKLTKIEVNGKEDS